MVEESTCVVRHVSLRLSMQVSILSSFPDFRMIRSSHQRCLIKRGVLRNFTKFTGKHPQVFCREFCVISKNTFFTEHVWWLLLNDAKLELYSLTNQILTSNVVKSNNKALHRKCLQGPGDTSVYYNWSKMSMM